MLSQEKEIAGEIMTVIKSEPGEGEITDGVACCTLEKKSWEMDRQTRCGMLVLVIPRQAAHASL